MCSHAYTITISVLQWCLLCHQALGPELEHTRIYKEVIMPPVVYNLTEELWERIKPWKKIVFQIPKRLGWYVTMLGMDEYLVMPITRMGKAKFYSARRLTENGGLKYQYPKDSKRLPWTSSDTLSNPIVICEGVADAAYVSNIASSIALLGNNYDGSLDDSLRGHNVLVGLDGDPVGITSAIKITEYLRQSVGVDARVIIFPDGKEPVDFELNELKEIIDHA